MQPGEGAFDLPAVSAKPFLGFEPGRAMRGRMCRRRQAARFFAELYALSACSLSGRLRGRPRGPAMGCTASSIFSSICPSWTLAAVSSMAGADRCHRSAGDACCRDARGRKGWVRYTAPFAGTSDASSAARFQLMRPASPSSWCRWARMKSQTPASVQSRSRRQQVMPEPQPSSRGRSSHWIPVLSTNTIPVSTLRSSSRRRPPLGASRMRRHQRFNSLPQFLGRSSRAMRLL